MPRTPYAVLMVALAGCAPTITEADQQNARIHHDIGISALNSGDLRAALRELLAAVELDPEQPHVHNALGLVYHAMNRPDDALEHYRKAVALKPGFSEAYNNLGVLLLDTGRYDEAIECFKKALADILYTTPALAEGNLGWALYQKGDVEAGLKHLRNAVAQSPKFCRGYEWLARIGLETDRPADAVASGKRFDKHCAQDASIAKTVSPDYLRRMQYYLAMGHLKQGERDLARQALERCAVTDPDAEFGSKCLQSLQALQ